MRPVVDAFRLSLEGEGLAGAVYVGKVTGTPPARYALVFPSMPDREQSRSTGPQSDLTYSFVVHSVGVDAVQTMWVAERVGRVVGRRLLGARVRHVSADPMRPDNSTAPGVMYLADEFELTL